MMPRDVLVYASQRRGLDLHERRGSQGGKKRATELGKGLWSGWLARSEGLEPPTF
jgi:hypothetical protein